MGQIADKPLMVGYYRVPTPDRGQLILLRSMSNIIVSIKENDSDLVAFQDRYAEIRHEAASEDDYNQTGHPAVWTTLLILAVGASALIRNIWAKVGRRFEPKPGNQI